MKKLYGIISLVVLLLFLAGGTILIWSYLSRFDGNYELFKEYIDSFGLYGYLIFLGIQFLQIFFALIPGEFVEFGAGYIFGAIEGFFLCMLGIAVASTIIFFMVRIFGKKLFEIITSKKDFDKLKFLNSENKLNLTTFFLFLIPGTPKDLLTYFMGMTKMKYSTFILIIMIARIPSVITSTIAGAGFAERRFLFAIIVYAVTGALSLGGMLLYRRYIKRRQEGEEAVSEKLEMKN